MSRLGEKLLEDIRMRGLRNGDRYLTTEQVSRMLGIRKSTANRVMRQLAKQQYLVRRQRSGTCVGPQVQAVSDRPNGGADSRRVLVQILLQSERGWSWGAIPSDDLISGVHDAIPGASVQFAFLPERDPVGYLDQVLAGALSAGWSLGVVAVSCSRDVYKFLTNRGVPAVVMGTVYPDTNRIPSVDADYAQVGRLSMEYLLAAGHRRVGLLTWQTWHPGDNLMLESINRTLTAAGMPPDSLLVRAVANDEISYELEVRQLLESENPPTALICRNQQLAGVASRAAQSLGLAVPGDITIIHEVITPSQCGPSPFPRVARTSTARQTAEQVAGMLLCQVDATEIAERHAVLPVEIREPDPSVFAMPGLPLQIAD
jgi:Periplasmic binding protein-like domain